MIADKLSKSIERLEGEMTPQEMEIILTKCKEVLDLDASITNDQVLLHPILPFLNSFSVSAFVKSC